MRLAFCIATVVVALVPRAAAAEPALKTRNVIVVTLDGFRWQEFFAGAEKGLIDRDAGGVRDQDGLGRRYLRATAEEGRKTLLPFIWGTVVRQAG